MQAEDEKTTFGGISQMSELWLTKEQVEKEAVSGKFNSSNIERIFRYRVLQDWLTMCGQIERLREENERLRIRAKDLTGALRQIRETVADDIRTDDYSPHTIEAIICAVLPDPNK